MKVESTATAAAAELKKLTFLSFFILLYCVKFIHALSGTHKKHNAKQCNLVQFWCVVGVAGCCVAFDCHTLT
jgi:hypothetical protein